MNMFKKQFGEEMFHPYEKILIYIMHMVRSYNLKPGFKSIFLLKRKKKIKKKKKEEKIVDCFNQ